MDRIVTGMSFPQYRIGRDPKEYYEAVEKMVAGLKRTGATHIMVNQAICSIPWTMDPENSYLRFTEYGYPMNEFVSTSYDRDIYYSRLMQHNRDALLHHAALARKYGLRAYIMCVEPTFAQETLFQRYPQWRGPRVDNPACSHKPLFAPCVHLPEVQDYYRQLIRGMLTLVPEIDEIHIFTNDTGAGFCHSAHLYAGPNGPVHCREVGAAGHAREFCRALLEAGRELNPGFRVIMTSGLSPHEKEEFIQGCPPGISSSVYGAFAWGGGLEDYWGNMAVGPKVYNNPAERRKIRAWALDDIKARIEPLRRNNTPIYASYSPLYYRADDPRPFETYRITGELLEFGVTNIIGGAPSGKYSVNGAVMRRAMAKGREDIEDVLNEIAAGWIGGEAAASLVAAWRLCDEASSEQPMLAHGGHCIMLQPLVIHMPLVPDDRKLSAEDLAYFMTPVLKDQEKMSDQQGGVWRVLHYGQENVVAYLEQYDRVVLPKYQQALGLLATCRETGELTETARECLAAQENVIRQQIHGHSYIRSWLLAALHKLAHLEAAAGYPSLQEVIDQQIDLAGDKAGERVRLMKAHRNDKLLQIDLSRFPVHEHPGTAGWHGAHEAQ